jgi:hypothetical protein
MSLNSATNYYTFDPIVIEGFLLKNDWSRCWLYLQEMLQSFSPVNNAATNIQIQSDMETDSEKQKLKDFSCLLGQIIFSLLTDPQSRLPDKSFSGLILCHEHLQNLFYLSDLHDTKHIIYELIREKKHLSSDIQKKILLLLSLRSDIDIVDILKRVDTKYRIEAVTAYLCYNAVNDSNVHANKLKLYQFRYDLEKTDTDFSLLQAAILAYFNCSYLNTPDRHIIKDNINKAVQKNLMHLDRAYKKTRADTEVIPKSDGDKPRLIAFMEVLSQSHAMVRSWGQWINSLSSEFDVTVLVYQPYFDPSLKDFFPSIESFFTINDLIAVFKKISPDVLILPSVGMSFFGIMVSTMRLAPLQIMGLGHPATTMSSEIDFVYGPRQLYHPDAFPSDRYISDNAPFKFVPSLSKEEFLSVNSLVRKTGDSSPLHVAIVGSNLKITAPFVEFLKEIETESNILIHFSFHMSSSALDTLAIEKHFGEIFKKFTYYGYKSYRYYLERLKMADIVLNPFPFGHTNTIIDTLLLGKPCLGLKGIEPSSQTESYILDILGYEDQFSANDIADYKQKFFKLSNSILSGQSPNIDRAEVYNLLYGESQRYDFGKVIKWVLDNKTALMSSEQKVFEALSNIV